MSDTIQLISTETIKKQYLEQYAMLTKARSETIAMLRTLGVAIPDDAPHNADVVTTLDRARVAIPPVSEPSIRALIRSAAKELGDKVSRTTITEYIKAHYPNREINTDSVGVTVSLVAKEDQWELVEKGLGGKPSVYRVPARGIDGLI